MPKGPVCQVDTASNGMQCADLNAPEKPYFEPFSNTDKYICRPDWYEQQVMEWAKRKADGAPSH